MANNVPDWLILIRHWTGRKNVGYALPFLAGARAMAFAREPTSLADCAEILDEIVNPPDEWELLQLVWCPNLEVPVIGLNKVRIPGLTLSGERTRRPSFIVQEAIAARHDHDFARIRAEVLTLCEEPIRIGLLSRTWNKTWAAYSPDEVRRIRTLLDIS